MGGKYCRVGGKLVMKFRIEHGIKFSREKEARKEVHTVKKWTKERSSRRGSRK